MTRSRHGRSLARWSGSLILAALGACGGEHRRDAADRPNLVLMVSDDQGLVLGCYGHPDVQTPRLDVLAAEGTTFRRAYAPTAVCTPSRATLMTGLMPMNHGARGFEPVAEGVRVWGEYFADAGYRTGLIGKIGVKPVPRFPFDFVARADKDDPAVRTVPWHLSQLDRFLDGDDGRPWCLVVNFRDSHWPFPTDGAPFGEDRLPPHPREGLEVPAALLDAPAVRAELARYYDGLRRMDATAGAMLDRIEERAPDDELVGLFTSDNGPPFPFAKTTLYEAGTHMPLIAFGAGVVRGQRDELVGLVDVLPTLLELAGGPVDGLDGRSLVPALEGRALGSGEVPWRDQIATTQDGHRVEPTIPVRAVRFGKWKYIRNWGRGLRFENNVMRTSDTWRAMVAAAERDAQVLRRIQRYVERPSEELYDLEADPEELLDLSRDAAMAQILEEGRRRLERSPLVDIP